MRPSVAYVSPVRRQDIYWTNYGMILIVPLRINFSDIIGKLGKS